VDFLILKVDFKKACDSVCWSCLVYMSKIFGFNEKWCAWMKVCVLGYFNLLVFVNGNPTKQIKIKRGLKQGDPLAPFLFLLVTEGLGSLTKVEVEFLFLKGFMVWGIGGGSFSFSICG
jgi:hypothetical protein